jgi:hypothetical protein
MKRIRMATVCIPDAEEKGNKKNDQDPHCNTDDDNPNPFSL